MKHKLPVIILMLGMAVSPYSLADEVNPQIANCEEITDEATQTQVEFCTAHIGCKMVMAMHKVCTKVTTFLSNLKNISFGKKKIDSGDVFEAAAPLPKDDAIYSNISKSIKASYDKQPKKQLISGEFGDGSKWVYEGPMNKGERHGTGVIITDKGGMLRGTFIKGRQQGKAEIANDKSSKVGVMSDFKLEGLGVERFADGGRYEGEFKDGLRHGEGAFKLANGDQYTGNWAADKKQGRGTYTWANGVRFEGEWRDNEKFNGTQIHTNGTQFAIANGVRVEPPQEAAARVAKSYDERISAAREQCTASKESCDTGCTAGAVVGFLSALADKGESAGEAGRQIQQCSDGCDEAKRGCEQQISSLEQQKSQAVAEAKAPKLVPQAELVGSAGSGASSGGSGHSNAAGRSCQDILNGLIDPVNDVTALSRLTPAQGAQESVWAMQTYMRVANTHPACANDAQSRQQVANMLGKEQERCRQGGFSNCDSGQNFSGTAARTDVAIRQLFQESSAQSGNAAQTQSSASGDCQAALNRQEKEFEPVVMRVQNSQSIVEQSQLTLGMINQQMALLDKLCKGQPQYGVFASLKQSYDATVRACMGVANNPSDCVARSGH